MRGHDWFDPVKYIPLGERDHWYLSLGGEAREWFEYFQNENWGVLPFIPADADQVETNHNRYLLQRYMFHGDFHLGSRVRAFGQFKSSIQNGRIGGPRPIIDTDEADVNQAFLDVHLLLNREKAPKVTLRVGRQEMLFGTGRMVGNREGPNVRLPFDGFRVILNTRTWRVDSSRSNRSSRSAEACCIHPLHGIPIWSRRAVTLTIAGTRTRTSGGTFATGSVRPLPFNLDIYYFGLKRKAGVFDQGIGPEQRNTLGGRIWKGGIPFLLGRGWDYDLEYAYQFGKFGPGPRTGPTFPFVQFAKADIRAWTISSQLGYTFVDTKLQPRVGVTTGIATGDKNASDPVLQTFYTPFPNGRFFGAIQQNGPLNIQGFRPNVTLQLPHRASLVGDVFFWRQSVNDGLSTSRDFSCGPAN